MTHITYIKDLIELPEQVLRGDFVLKLSEGLDKAKETVDSYVVTEQLVKCFDEALSIIRAAIDARSSKATYLHGSFGSGKSHFMAILHLLLQGNPHARAIPELAPVVAKHNQWTQQKRCLLVPYHMIDAKDLTSAVLGGYVSYVTRLHPDVPAPGVYLADQMFKDAQNLRERLGDEEFFKQLNKGKKGAESGWGAIEAGWEAESFEIAMDAPTAIGREKLVRDLVGQFFSAAKAIAEYVNIDEGLSIISKHAKSLGYDALILFLDELILWLASHAADVAFVSNEGPKLAKLVEAQISDRPIPIISFVARQRDLRELIGDHITGAELLSFSDTLKWWEGRFSKINLEDRNLPAIAEKRVLKPKNEAARQIMDNEFDKTAKIRQDVMNVLLTSTADTKVFRQVYPFSPALVETLVAVSFLLQRERTALKVMLQLLVEQKDTLKLGGIVPVGDLFDLISEGDEAFSDVMKVDFDNAKKLYYQTLRPLLEEENKITFEEMKHRPYDDATATALRNDDRLVKTLLLSALAPNVESLRGLTAGRLTALNHGTIKSPVEGKEVQIVLNKCRKWAGRAGQIKIGEDSTNNPTISVQLTGIDTDAIIQKAQSEDNTGNRIRKTKEILLNQFGIIQQDSLQISYDYNWRATKRYCDIVFANVWQLSDETFKNAEQDWRIIIDYPFDPENRSPKDDVARIETFRQKYKQASKTIIWLPMFLSLQAKRDLATLVKLDHILTGERFSGYVTHLSPADKEAAKTLLENQRSQLYQRMIRYLEAAYGVISTDKDAIDKTFEFSLADQFQSLDDGLTLKPPTAPNLKQAFQDLFSQALAYQFPAHPEFDSEVKFSSVILSKVYEEIKKAIQSEDGRLAVDKEKRKDLRAVANPLKIGEMAETHFVLGQHWKKHFSKKQAEHGGTITVKKLRQWIDEPQAMGLPEILQNLIINTFALQTGHSFYLHNSPTFPTLEKLPNEIELREQQLPNKEVWDKAVKRTREIFELRCSELLNAENLTKMVDEVKKNIAEIDKPCGKLIETLKNALKSAGQDEDSSSRLKTAIAVRRLIDKIKFGSDESIVEIIAQAEIPTTETAMNNSINRASDIEQELSRFNWECIETIKDLNDEWKDAALRLIDSLKEALSRDEYVLALIPKLKTIQKKAFELIKEAISSKPKVTAPIVQPLVQPLAQPLPQPPIKTVPNALEITPPLPEKTETIPTSTTTSVSSEPRKSLASGIIEVKSSEKEKLQEIFTQMKKFLENDSKTTIRIDWEVFKN